MSKSIHFHSEGIRFKLSHRTVIRSWLERCAADHNTAIENVNYIFCSDEYLLHLNISNLSHNEYTDILTFPLSEKGHPLEADIFISIDRIRDNATAHGESFKNELHRVIIHGMLHLLGYDDKTEREIILMRQKETSYISLLKTLFHVEHP